MRRKITQERPQKEHRKRMDNTSLGKLKRTLSERCVECGYVLEIRVRQIKTIHEGVDILVDEEYIRCSNCSYEKNIKPSKEKFDVKTFSNRDKKRERGDYGRNDFKRKRTH